MKVKKINEYYLKNKARIILEKNGWVVVFILQTNKNGWPDMQGHKSGVTVFIETKFSEKSPRPLQIFRHQQLKEQGFKVYVIKCLNDLECIKNI